MGWGEDGKDEPEADDGEEDHWDETLSTLVFKGGRRRSEIWKRTTSGVKGEEKRCIDHIEMSARDDHDGEHFSEMLQLVRGS